MQTSTIIAPGPSTPTGGRRRHRRAAPCDGIPGLIRRESAPGDFRVEVLRGGVSVLSGAGGNIAVVAGRDGKVMVDAGVPASRPQIADALALEDGVLRDDGPTPEQAAMRRAEADAALDAVLSLPALYRDVILPLTDEDGPPSYEDVARRCGLPVGTVRSRVHRAHVYARRSMADRGRVRPAAAAAAALGPAGEVGSA